MTSIAHECETDSTGAEFVRIVPRSTPDRLKSELLSAAFAENVSTIKGEVPKALQRRRRVWSVWGPRVAVVALPASVVFAVLGVIRRPAAPPVAPASMTGTAARGDVVLRPTMALDAGAMRLPVDPGVLELGVRRVILDAGHGGANRGTSAANGLQEKALTLDIAQRTRDLIAARGFDVVMTRTEDTAVSLQERAALANTRHGDIFVSIHLNALQPASARGIETYYLGPSADAEHDAIAAAENQESGYSLSDMRSLLDKIYADARRDESRRLATAVQQALVQRVRQIDPEMTNRGVKMAPFVVLVATDMPAILAEVSCLSNAEEVERLNTPGYRQTLAEALASGIQAFAHAERTQSSGS